VVLAILAGTAVVSIPVMNARQLSRCAAVLRRLRQSASKEHQASRVSGALLYWSPAMRGFRLQPADVADIASAYECLLARSDVDTRASNPRLAAHLAMWTLVRRPLALRGQMHLLALGTTARAACVPNWGDP